MAGNTRGKWIIEFAKQNARNLINRILRLVREVSGLNVRVRP